MLRNLRLAGRADITRLAGQLHRTEDKLERVLQEVEGLRDELAAERERRRTQRPRKRQRKPKPKRQMTVLERVARSPLHALEFANVLLTTDDAVVGATPREVVWTHRGTTLYRYRSAQRTHAFRCCSCSR